MLLLYDANPVFGAPPSVAGPRGHREDSLHRQFRQLHRRNQRLRRSDSARSRAARILARRCSRVGRDAERRQPGAAGRSSRCTTRAPCRTCCWTSPSRLGGPVAAALALEVLRRHAARRRSCPCASVPAPQSPPSDEDDFWTKVHDRRAAGGARQRPARSAKRRPRRPRTPRLTFAEPQFDGARQEFPFYFLPYASQSFRDGSLAHLPWLQEMPDVLTTAMWSQLGRDSIPRRPSSCASRRAISSKITSQHGSVRAPAILSPGIAPDLCGHAHRAGAREISAASPAAAARTRSRFSRRSPNRKPARWPGPPRASSWRGSAASSEGKLIVFAGGMSRFPLEEERR